MKILLLATMVLLSAQAFASTQLIYRCVYDIYPPLGSSNSSYEFSGNIIPAEATQAIGKTTYLTLAPNEISQVGLDARIWFYNDGKESASGEISLNQPGKSAESIASTTINNGNEGRLSYTDDKGGIYTVICTPQ